VGSNVTVRKKHLLLIVAFGFLALCSRSSCRCARSCVCLSIGGEADVKDAVLGKYSRDPASHTQSAGTLLYHSWRLRNATP